jgi:hypothetical protein
MFSNLTSIVYSIIFLFVPYQDPKTDLITTTANVL